MKKTHEERMKFIDSLERKYRRKVQLSQQARRNQIRNTLRAVRGVRPDGQSMYFEFIDDLPGSGLRPRGV